jgi:hypothetical protein
MNNQQRLPDEVLACIQHGQHLTSCDNDGYCNFCGHQEWNSREYFPAATAQVPHVMVYDSHDDAEVVAFVANLCGGMGSAVNMAAKYCDETEN